MKQYYQNIPITELNTERKCLCCNCLQWGTSIMPLDNKKTGIYLWGPSIRYSASNKDSTVLASLDSVVLNWNIPG